MTDAKPQVTEAAGGAFVSIDEKKLGREGLKLVGGLEALMRAIRLFTAIRLKSSDVRERVFLGEVCEMLMQGVQQHQDKLAEHAVPRGAGKIIDVEDGAKAN